MINDDVVKTIMERRGKPRRMRGVDEALQGLRTSVRVWDGVRVHAPS
jgi:hypothetical protein